MKNIKKFLFLLMVVIASGTFCASAQVEVMARPVLPHYERTVAPSPRHVWIDEDWEPRGSGYAFIGGRWAEPPTPGGMWVPGHWKHRHGNWVWIPGHWR